MDSKTTFKLHHSFSKAPMFYVIMFLLCLVTQKLEESAVSSAASF